MYLSIILFSNELGCVKNFKDDLGIILSLPCAEYVNCFFYSLSICPFAGEETKRKSRRQVEFKAEPEGSPSLLTGRVVAPTPPSCHHLRAMAQMYTDVEELKKVNVGILAMMEHGNTAVTASLSTTNKTHKKLVEGECSPITVKYFSWLRYGWESYINFFG